jgi:hypothetical protein
VSWHFYLEDKPNGTYRLTVSASPEPACARSAGPTAGVYDIPEAFAFTSGDLTPEHHRS